jgi:hypothetical protein
MNGSGMILLQSSEETTARGAQAVRTAHPLAQPIPSSEAGGRRRADIVKETEITVGWTGVIG